MRTLREWTQAAYSKELVRYRPLRAASWQVCRRYPERLRQLESGALAWGANHANSLFFFWTVTPERSLGVLPMRLSLVQAQLENRPKIKSRRLRSIAIS